MVKLIFLKELYGYIHDRRMILSMAIILLLMVINGVLFQVSYRGGSVIYQEVAAQNQDNLQQDQGDSHLLKVILEKIWGRKVEDANTLFDLAFVKQQLMKKPSGLAFISEAENGALPDGISADYFSIDNPQHIKSSTAFPGSFTSMDWTNILIYFISFICICFGYNAFSGERVDGTLKLMLTQLVTRWQIILGKFLGIFTVIVIPVVLGMIFNLVIIGLSGQVAIQPGDVLVILFFFLVSLLFISLNILLSFLVSLLTSTPAQSLGIGLIVWIILAIIVPNTSWLLAGKLSPVESVAETSLVEDKTRTEETKGCSWNWDYHWANQAPNPQVFEREKCKNTVTRVHNEIWNEYRNQIIHQTHTAIDLTRLSPFGIFRFVGENLSDNGFAGYCNFYNQFQDYHTSFQKFIREKDAADPQSYHMIWNESYNTQTFMSNKKVAYAEIPQFRYKPPSLVQALHNTLPDLLWLVCWCVGLFFITFVAFVRYDVR
jgi:ABC-2 type transport system permease protein